MIVVNVIIIAVVIIIIVNVKEMYTSHGLFSFYCRKLAVFFHSYLYSLSKSFSLSLFVFCAKSSFLLSFTLVYFSVHVSLLVYS